MGHVAAVVAVREVRIQRQTARLVVLRIGPAVRLAVFVPSPVLQAQLGVFRDGLRVSEVAAELIAHRRGFDPLVEQVERRIVVGTGRSLVRPAVGGAFVVRIPDVAVDGDRPADLAQLGSILQELADAVARAVGLALAVEIRIAAVAPLTPLGQAPGGIGLVAESGARHQRLVVGDLPLDAGVQTMVRVRDDRAAVLPQGIALNQILLVLKLRPAVARRKVLRAGVVEEVAPLKGHLIPLAPGVRVVQSDGVHRGDARLRAHHVLAHAVTAGRAARHALCRRGGRRPYCPTRPECLRTRSSAG